MASLSPEFKLSLGAARPTNSEPISSIIQRINTERGGFLGITEDSLLQEIAEAEAGDDGDESSSSEEEEEEPDKLKELMAAREEIKGQIESAHQSAMVALDITSLLLSTYNPTQANSTLSQALRDLAGIGTLGVDKLASSRLTEPQKQDNKKIAKGWKASGLIKNADAILSAAERLEREVEYETKYWEQLRIISENGWAVCRLPGERHTLGVRFGFSEASPAFRNRSLAALRRNADGSISLDQGLAGSEPKSLRVSIRSQGSTTGTSSIPLLVSEDSEIEPLIQQSRNSIFSEELWHELNREARLLGSLAVKTTDSTLSYPLFASKTVVIELVPLTSSPAMIFGPDDQAAEAIFLSLSLLLSYAHRQNHRKRTLPPAPISANTVKTKLLPYNLLRPLITRVAHQSTINQMQGLLSPLCAVLTKASFSPTPSYTLVPTPWTPPAHLSNAEKTMQSLVDRLESVAVLQLAPNTTLSITIRTALATASSNFILALNAESPLNQSCKAPPPLPTFDAVQEYVYYCASCAVTSSFIKEESGIDGRWKATAQANVIRLEAPLNKPSKQFSISFHTYPPQIATSPRSSPSTHPGKEANERVKMRAVWAFSGSSISHEQVWDELRDSKKTGVTPPKKMDSSKGEGSYEWTAGADDKRNKNAGDGDEIEEVVKSLADVIDSAEK